MRPPRFAEAPHQRRVARFEKNQDRIEPRHLPQLLKHRRERRQESALTHVDDDRDLGDVAAGRQRQLGERRNQRRREVVDTEVPEIFERADCLRFSRARESGQHDEGLPGFLLLRLRRRRFARAQLRRPGAHREPPGSSSSSSSSGAGRPVWRSVRSRRSASARAA